jgi:hypothetical protein
LPNLNLDIRWQLDGLRTVIFENQFLRITILPELGARIYQLIYKPPDVNLLWTNPRIPPTRVNFASRYDDIWCGGWDELFPNCEAAVVNGEVFPDHGEICSAEWDFETMQNTESILARFRGTTRISGALIEKTITLHPNMRQFQINYLLHNNLPTVTPILWNLHVAMAVSEHHRLEFPDMKARLESKFLGSLVGAPNEFQWSTVKIGEESVDLARVPPLTERRVHFCYGVHLAGGWCGITNHESGLACGLSFDPSVLRSLWLFGSFGGWRNLNVAVIEPSTGYPFRLEEAIQAGTCYQLEPDYELRTSVLFTVAENVSQIRGVTSDGRIL